MTSRTEPTSWRRRTILATSGLVAALACTGTALAANAEAEAFIAEVGDQVVEILRREGASDEEKLAALKKMLDSYTDLDLVARLVLGRHWRTASEEERKQYVDLFRRLLMNTMAERLGDYGGETFEIVGSNELNERDTQVETRIVRPSGGQPLKVDWRVRQSDGKIAIIDLVAEGVSLVVSQRNEVGSIVDREGMSGLIEAMRERSGEGESVL